MNGGKHEYSGVALDEAMSITMLKMLVTSMADR
jgi:hypothetical protein